MRPLLVAVPMLLSLAACTAFDGLRAEEVPAASVQGESPSETEADEGAVSDGTSRTNVETTTSGTEPAPEPNPQASAPSCAQKHGGATCGADGKSDCCAVATQGDVKLGKYMITAGRMRAFIDKVNGDVAGFVNALPADKWRPEWSASLPTSRESADVALGPAGKKACEQGANTGHTFWTPKTPSDFSDYDQATLDEKALNCVPWQLAQALCAFDGGHLPTAKDLRAAFTNGGQTKFPWGDESVNPNAPDPKQRLNLEFGFATDPNPATFRGNGHPSEVSFFIAPPGRFPNGDNQVGIADSAGNLLEWVGDAPRQFIWKGDFESHAENASTLTGNIWMDKEPVTNRAWIWGNGQLFGNAGSGAQKDGYYAIGARCAF